jgi:hypothetical protein
VNLSEGYSEGHSNISSTYSEIANKFVTLANDDNLLNLFLGLTVRQTSGLICDLILHLASEMSREICMNNCNLGGALISVTKFWKLSQYAICADCETNSPCFRQT